MQLGLRATSQKATALFIVLATFLTGCSGFSERMERAAAAEQQFNHQCAVQGGVRYKRQCMSPEEASAAKLRDFVAAENEKNRKAMLEAACISNGGVWDLGSCVGGGNVFRN